MTSETCHETFRDEAADNRRLKLLPCGGECACLLGVEQIHLLLAVLLNACKLGCEGIDGLL